MGILKIVSISNCHIICYALYIFALPFSIPMTGSHRLLFRLVKRQNRKLRSLIREEMGLAEAVSEAQLVQMGLKEIRELIAEATRKRKSRWEF